MDVLATLLYKYCGDNYIEAKIDCFASAEALLAEYRPGSWQILFLDVIMDGLDGISAAKTIRETDEEAAIIFITVSPDFAVDSYRTDASYYIVKPVDMESLGCAMKRCRRLTEQNTAVLWVSQNRRAVSLRHRDILYLETQRNDCVICAADGEYRTRKRLSELEAELEGAMFLRCHNSFIVNLRWAADLAGGDFILRTGQTIPVSKAYYAAARERFERYMFDEARDL